MIFTAFSTSFSSNDGRVYAELLLPKDGAPLPLAILCHGAGSDHRVMEDSATQITGQGEATFLFDFRGHGLSSGVCDGKMDDDILAAFNHLANYPELDLNNVALVGHSMGAGAALLAASKADNLSALVLLSCPPDEFESPPEEIIGMRGNTAIEYPRQGPVPWVKPPLSTIYRSWMGLKRQRMRINWYNFFQEYRSGNLSMALAKMKPCPLLFVHCLGDRYAPYQAAIGLYEQAQQPKDIMLSPKGFHSSPITSGKLRNKWASWLVSALTRSRQESNFGSTILLLEQK